MKRSGYCQAGKVVGSVQLVEVDEVGVGLLDPAPRRLVELMRDLLWSDLAPSVTPPSLLVSAARRTRGRPWSVPWSATRPAGASPSWVSVSTQLDLRWTDPDLQVKSSGGPAEVHRR